jgi:hypothetical protein
MPEFEGTSDTLSLQAALEDAVRKAYTGYERRTHTEPLQSYVVKRITGYLRTVTVVIETVADARPAATPEPAPEPAVISAPDAAPAAAEADAPAGADVVSHLLAKERRNEPLTPNERALLDLLRRDPNTSR